MKLKDYIQGKRYGKEANRLEREAMNDPFLQDAIDGFDSVSGDHFSAIEKLEKQIASQPKRMNNRVWMWAAAAVLVLLIGIPFLLQKPNLKDVQLASSDNIKHEEQDILLPEKDTVLVAKSFKTDKEEVLKPTQKMQSIVIADEQESIEQNSKKVTDVNDINLTAQYDVEETAIETSSSQITEKLGEIVYGVVVSPIKEDKLTQNILTKDIETISSKNQKIVSGRLIDEYDEPIIGANIHIKGTEIETVSDIDGNFKLSVPENEDGVLIASYIGMKNSETPLKENLGNIVMENDTKVLNEVIVVAYGTKQKRLFPNLFKKKNKYTHTFGETEFKKFFEENYDRSICAGEPILVKVEFFVNDLGQPGSIVIKENSCPELETEIKRLLLGSPKWSQTNRKVTLNLTLIEQRNILYRP